MRFFVVAVFLASCSVYDPNALPARTYLPKAGAAGRAGGGVVAGVGGVVAGHQHDAGVSGSVGVDAGSGASGSAGAHDHHDSAVAGAAGVAQHSSGHGGLEVMLPLPVGSPGSSGLDVDTTGELPTASSDGVGAFRNVCKFGHASWDDPIVFPGQPNMAHLHMFFGNSSTDAFSTYDSLRAKGDGNCRGGIANRSAYWTPALLDQNNRVIVPVEMHVYYKSGYKGVRASDIKRFPNGLRLIAGNAKSVGPQDTSIVSWQCEENYTGQFSNPGKANCQSSDTVAMNVFFPQCWDGSSLDSADHKSHVVYPQRGGCPSDHPVAIPELSFHIRYRPDDIRAAAGLEHLSSDMYDFSAGTGCWSAHGDWFEAWSPEFPDAFVPKCIAAGNDCKSHMFGDGRVMR